MTIDIYLLKYSPPCRAVLMAAKELNIEFNIKVIDLSEGQHMTEEYLKINPAHTVPAIDDNGFTLWESHAIMQYLCNKYAPDSSLYPKEPKQRAHVDRWLNFDLSLFSIVREAFGKPFFGAPATEQTVKSFKDNIKLLDQLIGDNKYLVGDHLTIADLSILATISGGMKFGLNLSDYPNINRWLTALSDELSYFAEFNNFDTEELKAYANKMKEFIAKNIL